MLEIHDNLWYAANVASAGIQGMREPSGHYLLPRAVRYRNGFSQSPANDLARGILSRNGDQGVTGIQGADTGSLVSGKRRSVLCTDI